MSDIRIVSIKQETRRLGNDHEEIAYLKLSNGKTAGGSFSLNRFSPAHGNITKEMIDVAKQEALLNAFNYILSNYIKDSA
jgi:hypothetical protein